jgi:hypothetical protein
MERIAATKFLREKLDTNGLSDWSIRFNQSDNPNYFALCSYRDKCIILNAHYVDQNPAVEVENTLNHEVAHALTESEKDIHGPLWAAKAKELGCTYVSPFVLAQMLRLW